MNNNLSRRNFLKYSSLTSLGFLGFQQFIAQSALAGTDKVLAGSGYGPLLRDPAGVLSLPKGFSYKIISTAGSKMSDGLFTPGRPDGMATFKGAKGRTIIIRNHENGPADIAEGPFGKSNELLSKVDRTKLYDYGKGEAPCLGGTTTLEYDHASGKVINEYLSLGGTSRNCAGGATPWNSWISCEENTASAKDKIEKDHGYNFEVPASGKGLIAPVPLKAMGRFNHEAVCVDPKTSIVYQTEDRADGLIYRYVPEQATKLGKGGKLQALAILGEKSFDTRNWEALKTESFPQNKLLKVEWIDLEDIQAPDDDLRLRGFTKGAARFARGEGAWFGKNECYFACTNGGKIGKGQVFKYIPSPFEGTAREKEDPGKLELFVEPNNIDIVKSCDNLTVSPWGDVILCEDDPHPFVVGVTAKGEFYKLAENIGKPSEFAGGVFSPNGDVYFVNLQDLGLTFAISGPWKKV